MAWKEIKQTDGRACILHWRRKDFLLILLKFVEKKLY